MEFAFSPATGGRGGLRGQRYEPVKVVEEVEQLDSLKMQELDLEQPFRFEKGILTDSHRRQRRQLYTALLGGIGVLLVLWYTLLNGYNTLMPCSSWQRNIIDSADARQSCDDWEQGYTCQPSISQYWGQYSPFFSVPTEIPAEIPDQCKVTFVQVLSRHGARDPTASKTEVYNATVQKIHANAKSYSKEYAFIKDYGYTLGADLLSIFGQQQLVNSGTQFYHRYREFSQRITPFVRASDQNRVVESAQNWTQGFHSALLNDLVTVDDDYPYDIVLISEDKGQNNTLSHGLCTAFEDSEVANDAQGKWADVFIPPIVDRLNENMPGANLTALEAVYIMDLCPFNTVASTIGAVSPFCTLFTEEDWWGYDYYQSLGKYYGSGWGNPLGATQGVGFTNELIARLTATPVNDHTSTNHTLDDSEETFPVGGRAILFADFSHDNDMTAIFAAMGLHNETKPLLNQTLLDIKETKGFSAAWTVPFAARAYFEKLQCAGESEEYVRVILNDRVLPLKTCGGDEFGRCQLSAFLEGLSFARAGGDWDRCFI